MPAAAPRHHWTIRMFKKADKTGSFVQWCLDKNNPRQAWERDSCPAPLVISLSSIPRTQFVLMSSTLPTSAFWNCLWTEVLALHLLFWLFATCIFGLIWVTVYFKHSPPPAYFVPTISAPVIAAGRNWGQSSKHKAIVQSCLVCPRLQSRARLCIRAAPSILQQLKVVYLSSLHAVTSDRFTAHHRPLWH